MNVRKIMKVLLLVVPFLLTSCAFFSGADKKAEEKSKQKVVEKATGQMSKISTIVKEGKIDNIRQEDILLSGLEEAITFIGFDSGDGCIVQGIHPGLQKGKRVRLTLKKLDWIFKSTAVFEVVKIEKPDAISAEGS